MITYKIYQCNLKIKDTKIAYLQGKKSIHNYSGRVLSNVSQKVTNQSGKKLI